jgi:hypothetical protein
MPPEPVTNRHPAQPDAASLVHLKNWRILTNLRTHVRHATALLRALLVLTNIEIAR